MNSDLAKPVWSSCLHLLLSAAKSSHLLTSMSSDLRSILQTSRKRSFGHPWAREPAPSCPYSRSWGIRPSDMRLTCPSQRSLRCWRRSPIFASTSVFVTWSDHLMPRMRLKLLQPRSQGLFPSLGEKSLGTRLRFLMWNALSRLSWPD